PAPSPGRPVPAPAGDAAPARPGPRHEQVEKRGHRVAQVQRDADRRVDEQVECLVGRLLSVVAHVILPLPTGSRAAAGSLGNVAGGRRTLLAAAAPRSNSALATTTRSPNRT